MNVTQSSKIISSKLVIHINKKLLLLIIVILLIIANKSVAQNEKPDKYQQLEKKYERLKDSVAHLYALVPAVSSIMVNNRQLEINFFNSMISAYKYRDENGDLTSINFRQTYFYNTIQLTYGVSKNARFNVGMDVNSVFGRIDQDVNSS